jgi:ParB/RepB/Spo0J family partition protein
MNEFNLHLRECRIAELEMARIGKRYADLRIVKPRAEAAMEKSMRQCGQIQPVVCVAQGEGFELIDGFKRLRAMQKLGGHALSARVVEEQPARVCKTLMVQLNQRSLSISELEEARVIASLHREENLKQVEIAVLFGRDKSWVSRRLALVELLHEEVEMHIQLGLLPQVCGRELSRLPRGNQAQTLKCVLKHHLTSRQTAKLTRYLLSRPRWEYDVILHSPWEVLGDDSPRPRGDDLAAGLRVMRRCCCRVAERLAGMPLNPQFNELIHEALAAAETAVNALKTWDAGVGYER